MRGLHFVTFKPPFSSIIMDQYSFIEKFILKGNVKFHLGQFGQLWERIKRRDMFTCDRKEEKKVKYCLCYKKAK